MGFRSAIPCRFKLLYKLPIQTTYMLPSSSLVMLDPLPNELLLHIFSFLEIKPYLISRAVCKKWQMLLPHADVHPIRRRMLQLFHHMLQSPDFLNTHVLGSWRICGLSTDRFSLTSF
ncbi:hypothetical protein CPC08DRAFT_785135 [Agrocybe pediades]|nr:hypothetical protein CPC08DRAFT_785135 [Agrocybe pediades]